MPTEERPPQIFVKPTRSWAKDYGFSRRWQRYLGPYGAVLVPAPATLGAEGQLVYSTYHPDPILNAMEGLAEERANLLADIVVQGTLAYAHVEDFSYAVERCIPVDLYSETKDASQISGIVESFNNLFRALGFDVITHPDIAHSSTHGRSVLKTRPLTAEQFKTLEGKVENVLQRVDGQDGRSDSSAEDFARAKDIAEIVKLNAETHKILTAETDLTRAQTKQAEEETKKAFAERVAAAAEAFNKFAAGLLKTSVAIVVLVGGISLTSGPRPDAGQPAPQATVQVHKPGKESNLKRFGEFLEKLAEQQDAAGKLAGGE